MKTQLVTFMACNGVPAPSPRKKYLPPRPKIFNPPPVLKLFTPRPTGNGCFCTIHTWLLPRSTYSYFWSYYNWLNAVIINFWISWNNTLKKHVFTIILFYFFMCDNLSFINTTQKTSKPSEKCFNYQDGWEKTSYPGISADGYWRKHEGQVASEKVYWKNNRVFQTLATYCHWKNVFSELNRRIFQISL